jgi:hypothetical protein
MSRSEYRKGLPSSQNVVKRWDQRLSQPEGERELRTSHEKLRNEPLEEGREALVPGHLGENPDTALGVVEVLVLDTGLDDIERSRHDQRGRGTGNGGDEVLEPGRLVVVLETEDVLLCKCGTTEKLVKLAEASA